MIACDLFAALAIADWPKREWTVLAEILLQQYGPQKRVEAFVEPKMIQRLTGLNAKNVYRALKNLKNCNVIRDGENGGYVFIKDFERWSTEEVDKMTGSTHLTDRLRGEERTFALSAPKRYGLHHGIQRDTKTPSLTLQSDTKTPSLTLQSDTKTPSLTDSTIQTDTKAPEFTCETGVFGIPLDGQQGGGQPSNGIPNTTNLEHTTVSACHEIGSSYENSLACDRRRAPKIRDLEKKETHIFAGASEDNAAPNLRNPDDLAEVNEAIRFLGSYPNTEHIAQFLGQMHNTPNLIGIYGWRWIVAAHRIAQRPNVRRLGFEYLKSIAVNATRADLDDIRSEATLIADTSGADTSAALQPARRLTAAERRKLDKAAWNLTGSQLKDEET